MNRIIQFVWMSSGSCPLCLTPPCWPSSRLRGGSFFVCSPDSGAAGDVDGPDHGTV